MRPTLQAGLCSALSHVTPQGKGNRGYFYAFLGPERKKCFRPHQKSVVDFSGEGSQISTKKHSRTKDRSRTIRESSKIQAITFISVKRKLITRTTAPLIISMSNLIEFTQQSRPRHATHARYREQATIDHRRETNRGSFTRKEDRPINAWNRRFFAGHKPRRIRPSDPATFQR
ncbi:hypothetical protein K0M31_015267 [Melipona bicolor]|uniref:Uncharacterized protein n=1 Tax=Melipona bicolor TaxID=60889 RepID=A0AA40FFS8_9HYME|nr:hypothetical protein K0M31_015267 [Melipona bicolor]